MPLGLDDVHVWRFALDLSPAETTLLGQTLAAEEIERASRFHHSVHRERFIVAHGGLRAIVSQYVNLQPSQLRFLTNPYGKPSIKNNLNGDEIRFNLSHSQNLALVAITRGRSVGVDVEHIRPDFAEERIARRFFSPQEVESLLSFPIEKRIDAFFACWTRKEAYIKAKGEGLSMPLDQFDVSLIPGEKEIKLSTRPDPAQGLHWKIYELSPGPGFVGALAVNGLEVAISCWQWTG